MEAPETTTGNTAGTPGSEPSRGLEAPSQQSVASDRRGRPARALANDEVLRDAAVALIGKGGWDELTLSAVARYADLTLGAMYSRFENKAELGLDVWTNRALPHFRQRLRDLDVALNSHTSHEALLGLVHEHLASGPLFICFNELLQAAAFDSSLRDVIVDDVQEALTPWIQIDPVISARNAYIISLLLGISLLAPVSDLGTRRLDDTTPEIWTALTNLCESKPLDPQPWLPYANWKAASGDPTRDKIHESVVSTVARTGYEGATISRICRAADISSGSLFSRYESKAEVFTETYRSVILAGISHDAAAMEQVNAAADPDRAYVEYLIARLLPAHRPFNLVQLEFLRLASRDSGFREAWDELQQVIDGYYDKHYQSKAGKESLAVEQQYMRASARWGLRLLSITCPSITDLPLDAITVSLSRLPNYFEPRDPSADTSINDADATPIAHRRRSSRALANDQKLRSAALASIVSDGWAETSLTKVAKTAGLTLGAVYSRFEDKTDLALDLWRSSAGPALAAMFQTAKQALNGDGDPAAWASFFTETAIADPGSTAAIELAVEALFDDELAEYVKPEIQAHIQDLISSDPDGGGRLAYGFSLALGLVHATRIDPSMAPQIDLLNRAQRELVAVSKLGIKCENRPAPEFQIEIDSPDIYEKGLLEAARQVLSDRGYERSTVAHICRRAGISSGSLFGRYATKLDLISDCVRRSQLARIEVQARASRETMPDASPPEIMNVYVRSLLSQWNRQTRRCYVEFSRIARTHDEARQQWIDFVAERRTKLPDLFRSLPPGTFEVEAFVLPTTAIWGLRLLCEFEPGLADLCYCPPTVALFNLVE